MHCGCADPDHFLLPPPPGVSQQLHDWMVESGDLVRLSRRLKRLKDLKAQLTPPEANGAAHLYCHVMRLHAATVLPVAIPCYPTYMEAVEDSRVCHL